MIEDYLLLEITKELYLEETGLYVASDSKAEWERVKQQFPQKYSLARSKAKAHMKDWDNDLLDEARQADYGSLIREFIFAERQENILASKFISGVYGLNDANRSLLYIGETENIFVRLKRHRRKNGIDFKTVQYVGFDFENRFLRKRLEAYLIETFKPPLNQQGVGRRDRQCA